ncbi:LOG family protein [Candidatus Saccharibacteria bacterium]|nr:LOG family protein [Candidatus Saccharibacteria bacterium]
MKDEKVPTRLQYTICVSGAAAGSTVELDYRLAERLGAAIARRGHVLTTGATVGLPFYAARGAKKSGGLSIGFSPASGVREHLRKYRLPRDYFDFVSYTGLHYVGRDAFLIQSSDAVITLGGRFGSLHEFVTALEAHKPIGVLTGTSGAADVIPELMKVLEPPKKNLVVYDDNPENLVSQVIALLDREYADIHEELLRNEHWFLEKD